MGKVNISQSGGGGITSDDVTVIKAHVLKGETALTSDSNDEVVNGEMEVNSLLSFSAAAYSGRRVLLKWQNPYAAPGKPYSGVVIKWKIGDYTPWNSDDFIGIYVGAGNNTAPGGWSQVYVDLPALNTTYYFTALSYATTNFGDIYSPVYNTSSIKYAVCTTGSELIWTLSYTQTVYIPDGFSYMDVFAVGGGGSGGLGYSSYGGGGGAGGYTVFMGGIPVSPGNAVSATIGTGGSSTNYIPQPGTATTVFLNGTVIATAAGGKAGSGMDGGDGGSGGGAGTLGTGQGGYGGSNGGYGSSVAAGGSGGKGQGTTTYYMGIAYSGGGSGGSYNSGAYAGGTLGGGGNGGPIGTNGGNGANGTGGGGGGGGSDRSSFPSGGHGGSGVVIIRLY